MPFMESARLSPMRHLLYYGARAYHAHGLLRAKAGLFAALLFIAIYSSAANVLHRNRKIPEELCRSPD